MMSDAPGTLEERLLAMYSHRGDGLPTQYVNPDGPDAVEKIASLRARVEELETAGRYIKPYLVWTVGPESPGYHPTMPSAVALTLASRSSGVCQNLLSAPPYVKSIRSAVGSPASMSGTWSSKRRPATASGKYAL